jgi:hypothetical protein
MSTKKIEAGGSVFGKDLVKKFLSEGDEEKAERTRICASSALSTLKAKSTVKTESTGKWLGIITYSPFKIQYRA